MNDMLDEKHGRKIDHVDQLMKTTENLLEN